MSVGHTLRKLFMDTFLTKQFMLRSQHIRVRRKNNVVKILRALSIDYTDFIYIIYLPTNS